MELTESEKRSMSLARAMTLLKDRCDNNQCEGDCDEVEPFEKCRGCEAAAVLNTVNELIREAL